MKDSNMSFEFEATSVPDKIKDQAVISNTRNYNSPHVDDDFMPLSVYCTDSVGEIVGGLTGKTYWNYLDIEYLWVHETHQNKDIATQVMALAEDEARKRGCSYAMLDTYEFQALDFYIKQGYECFGKLDDYCKKYERYYLKKTIAVQPIQEKA